MLARAHLAPLAATSLLPSGALIAVVHPLLEGVVTASMLVHSDSPRLHLQPLVVRVAAALLRSDSRPPLVDSSSSSSSHPRLSEGRVQDLVPKAMRLKPPTIAHVLLMFSQGK